MNGAGMILHVLTADVAGPHRLRLKFNDGTLKSVDVMPLLRGPVFKPLRDPTYFARASVDSIAGTVVWPNGADFAPEALHDLPAIESSPHDERAA
jgi:hypothetical protein